MRQSFQDSKLSQGSFYLEASPHFENSESYPLKALFVKRYVREKGCNSSQVFRYYVNLWSESSFLLWFQLPRWVVHFSTEEFDRTPTEQFAQKNRRVRINPKTFVGDTFKKVLHISETENLNFFQLHVFYKSFLTSQNFWTRLLLRKPKFKLRRHTLIEVAKFVFFFLRNCFLSRKENKTKL